MKISDIILSEGKGLYNRKLSDPAFTAVAGNQFGAAVGDPYKFQSIHNYPTLGHFPDQQAFTAEVAHVEKQAQTQSGHPVIWVNNANKKHLSFALVQFLSPDNMPLYFGKFFEQIEGNMAGKWDNNLVPGLRPELNASKKARAGLKPQDIFGAQDTFNSGVELMNAVNQSTAIGDNIKAGLQMLSNRTMPRFVGEAANFTAVRDNLGEIIQPLAVAYGVVGGDADLARKKVLKNSPWEKMVIHFPPGKTAGLVDFYLRSGNLSLGVSSKGDKGAPASAKNLYDGMINAKKTGQKLDEEYPFAAKIVTHIATSSMLDGPLTLAIEYGFITQPQAIEVIAMIKSHQRENPPKWIKPWTDLFAAKSHTNWNYGYWVLAAVAAKVASTINQNPEFSEGCIAFLNSSSMMQIYTEAAKDKNDAVITGFRSVYPPKFQGSIILDAGKSYYATGNHQKIVFDFKPA